MKRKSLTVMLLLLAFVSVACGATSNDTEINARLDRLERSMSELHSDMRVIMARIDSNEKIDMVNTNLSGRIEDVKTYTGWGMTILGLIIAFVVFYPSTINALKELHKRTSTPEEFEQSFLQVARKFNLLPRQ